MEPLVIIDDDINYSQLLYNSFNTEYDVRYIKVSEELKAWYEKIEENKTVELIFINIETNIGGKRQEQTGADILMNLRIRFLLTCHVVLYSIRDLSFLLKQKPENLIIASPGCSFFQVQNWPPDFDLNKLISNKCSLQNLKHFLKPAFSMEGFRHSYANWWGVKQLCDVHTAISKKNPEELYPSILKTKLNEFVNLLAVFIYGNTNDDIRTQLIESEKARLIKLEKILQEENRIKENHDANVEIIQLCQKRIKECNNSILSLLAENQEKFTEDLKNIKAVQEKDIKDASDESILLEKKIAYIESEKHLLSDMYYNFIRQYPSLEDISNTIKFIKSQKPQILLIDDEGKNGWADIFKILFHATLTTLPIKSTIEETIKELENSIVNKNLILLDLRLYPNIDEKKGIQVDEMTGIKVLKEIRKLDKGIPVIVTSASNKIWSYETAIKYGADGYWIKEGIDMGFSIHDSIDNFKRLTLLVNNCLSGEYKIFMLFCKSLGDLLKENSENSYWWENYTWKWNNGNEEKSYNTRIKKQYVSEIIKDTFFLYKEYLQSNNKNWRWWALIIRNLSLIVDLLHGTGCNVKLMKERGDKRGIDIYELRNDASHEKAPQLKISDFNRFIDNITSYILEMPNSNKYI